MKNFRIGCELAIVAQILLFLNKANLHLEGKYFLRNTLKQRKINKILVYFTALEIEHSQKNVGEF